MSFIKVGTYAWRSEATFGVNRLVTGCELAGHIGHDMHAAIDTFPIGEEVRAGLKAFYE